MRAVYLDFETYYDKDFSLHKLSIEAYVRDPRFDVHLLGVAINNGPIAMIPAEKIPEALKLLRLDDPDCITYAQNCRFDGFILSDYYKVHVANPMCTRLMSRWVGVSRLGRESLAAQCEFFGTGVKGTFLSSMEGVHVSDMSPSSYQEYVNYCTGDVFQLRENVQKMLPYMTEDAMQFCMMTLRMYLNPVFVVDTDMLRAYEEKLEGAYQDSMDKLQHLFKFPDKETFLKALRSKAAFCQMLEQLDVAVPYKLSEKKTETKRRELEKLAQKGDASAAIMLNTKQYEVWEPALAKSDPDFMALMSHENLNVAALATARAQNNSSIALSRCRTFLEVGHRGLLPVPLEAFQAHTGRYTAGTSDDVKSDSLNLQNLNKRTGDKTLRQAIRVPVGYKLIACDSSQIEARVLAWLAGQQDLLNDFRTGADPYCRMASVAYHEDYDTILYWTKGAGAKDPNGDTELKRKYKQYRNIGKTMVLQLGYYSGGDKLALYMTQQGVSLGGTPELHVAEARRLVKVYRQRNSEIKNFWKVCDSIITVLIAGQSASFGGPNNTVFLADGQHDVFGRKVPGIRFPDGYWLLYPELRFDYDEQRQKPVCKYTIMKKGKKVDEILHAGVLCNNITQGLAFSLMRAQALHINKYYPVRLNIHDSWSIVVPESEVHVAADYMQRCMRYLPEWAQGLPIDCEVEIGNDLTIA